MNIQSDMADYELRNTLKVLLHRYALNKHYRKPFENHKRQYKYHINPIRKSSRGATLSRKIKSSYNLPRVSLNKTPQGKANAFGMEIILLLHNVFIKLAELYSSTHWIQHKNEKLINICILKQFILDCFVCDKYIYELFLSHAKYNEWITPEIFNKCFDEILQEGHRKDGYFRKIARRNVHSLKIQKILCKNYIVGFSVVYFNNEEDLDRDELFKALSLVERKPKVFLNHLIERIMSKASETHLGTKLRISFKEFYYIINHMESYP